VKRKGKCVHYNGTVNECCKAGVNYRELAGVGEAWGSRLPCHSPEYEDGSGGRIKLDLVNLRTCEKRVEPTPEEIESEDKWLEERFERIGKIRDAIVTHLGGPWKRGMQSASGSIPCPCCAGTVRFSRSGYNGYISASCSTPKCARWME
jgi:hypothetical protein